MLMPLDLEIIAPDWEYCTAFMFGDGEIDVFFSRNPKWGLEERRGFLFFSIQV